MVPGWFSSPSSILLPSLCFCLSGPVPISKPWGVDSSAHNHWGSHACPDSCVLLSLYFREHKKLGHCSGSCLPYRWASVKPQHIQHAFDPTTAIDLVHGKAQTRLWMVPFILRMRVDKVNLSVSGWGSSESYCHCWCNMSWNIQTSHQTLKGSYGDKYRGKNRGTIEDWVPLKSSKTILQQAWSV